MIKLRLVNSYAQFVKTNIKPQEYYYLQSPLRSDAIEMLKYALQGLSITGHIVIYSKLIFINKNAKHKRRRIFAKLGPKYNLHGSYSKSESFLLSLFDKPELRLYEIRNRLLKKLDEKIDKFKTDYVYNDIKEFELCKNKFFLTEKGREEKKHIGLIIDQINEKIDSLVLNENELKTLLEDLGSNLIFLEEETLSKLKQNIPLLTELSFLEISSENLGDSFYFSGIDSFASFDSFGDVGGSDFDFGGGGSGDSW